MATDHKDRSGRVRARVSLCVLTLSLVLLALFSVTATAAGGADIPFGVIDEAEECLEAVPAESSVAGITDDGRAISLDVHFLLDGVSTGRAAEVIGQAQKAYEALGIDLVSTMQEISIPAQRSEPEFIGGPSVPTSDSSYLFAKTKEAVGGSRPLNSDVVYLLTSDHITGAVAGQADCIGGVRYPNRAFAIGEEEADSPHGGIAICCTWTTAKIFAHEIAHLLGAHHHYANCAEGAPAAAEDRHLGTCTMMFNDVGLVNLRFSLLEGAVVRGHAVKFADRPREEAPAPRSEPSPRPRPSSSQSPAPDPSPSSEPSPRSSPAPEPSQEPEPESGDVTYGRSVSLDLVRHLVARGRVDAGEATTCSTGVSVRIQRWTGVRWKRVRTAVTDDDGTFRARVPDRKGRFRAIAPEVSGTDGDRSYTCSAAASAPRRHKHR